MNIEEIPVSNGSVVTTRTRELLHVVAKYFSRDKYIIQSTEREVSKGDWSP